MLDLSDSTVPNVSIVLPTYNRAQFLPAAFESICNQTHADWELIVVDDGSTDDTQHVIAKLSMNMKQSVRYVSQSNQGSYAARNTGLDLARGKHIAFFDSDDLWLPHHLKDCISQLDANADVDWVWGACRIVSLDSGKLLVPNTFYINDRPQPFTRLKVRNVGRLRVIEDPDATRCQILHGLYCGLQNSVMRRKLFDGFRFPTHLRNEAEDQVLVIRSLKLGFLLGFVDNVHVIYHVHAGNSSASASNQSIDKQLEIHRTMVRGFHEMCQLVQLSPRERHALDRRLSHELFWNVGYSLLWQNGRSRDALDEFRRGLRLWPTNWRYWKTYLLARIRVALGRYTNAH